MFSRDLPLVLKRCIVVTTIIIYNLIIVIFTFAMVFSFLMIIMIRQVLEADFVYTNETCQQAPLLVRHSLLLFGKAGNQHCHQTIIVTKPSLSPNH